MIAAIARPSRPVVCKLRSFRAERPRAGRTDEARAVQEARRLAASGRRCQTRYAPNVERTLVQRIRNPHNYDCGCLPECWCNRTAIGRLVKWWFPARWFGIRHKNAFFDGMTTNEIQAWKEEQERRA